MRTMASPTTGALVLSVDTTAPPSKTEAPGGSWKTAWTPRKAHSCHGLHLRRPGLDWHWLPGVDPPVTNLLVDTFTLCFRLVGFSSCAADGYGSLTEWFGKCRTLGGAGCFELHSNSTGDGQVAPGGPMSATLGGSSFWHCLWWFLGTTACWFELGW